MSRTQNLISQGPGVLHSISVLLSLASREAQFVSHQFRVNAKATVKCQVMKFGIGLLNDVALEYSLSTLKFSTPKRVCSVPQ